MAQRDTTAHPALTDNERQELWRLMLIGQRKLWEHFSTRIKQQHGLTGPQFEALIVLHPVAPHGLTMSRLSKSLLYSSGSASHLVDRLEQLGYVRRQANTHDGRKVEVVLTPRGTELISGARDTHFGDLDRVFAPLVSDTELPTLLAFAKRMVASHPDTDADTTPKP